MKAAGDIAAAAQAAKVVAEDVTKPSAEAAQAANDVDVKKVTADAAKAAETATEAPEKASKTVIG